MKKTKTDRLIKGGLRSMMEYSHQFSNNTVYANAEGKIRLLFMENFVPKNADVRVLIFQCLVVTAVILRTDWQA